jgi:hypothetical protein
MNTRHSCSGGTLIVALLSILLVTAFIGVAYKSTGSAARLTDRSRDLVQARLASEGVIEYAFGIWKQRIQNQDRAISTAEAMLDLTAPAVPGFQYASDANLGPLKIQATDTYGAPIADTSAIPAAVSVNLADYPGWRGRSFNYVVSTRLQQTNPTGSPLQAGAMRRFQYIEVPLFQAMFFYEHDLEMYRPAAMTVSGLVHTNRNLYLSTGTANTLTIQSFVSHVGNFYSGNGGASNSANNTAPPEADTWSGYGGTMYPPTYAGGGLDTQVNQVSRYEPLGKDATSLLSDSDSNPNNDSFRELIEPPVTGAGITDPPEIAKRRLFNQAGVVLTVNGTGVTVATKNGTSLTTTQVTNIKAAFTGKTTFYDQREGRNVDVATFDVSKLTPVLNAAAGFNGVLYVHDTSPKNASDPEPKSIRLTKGGVLPNTGLSVVSQNPVYVQGDFNTGTTTDPNSVPANSTGNPNNTSSPTVGGYTRKPAAVMADAVMMLSNSWSDANASSSVSSRPASNTTYNMAILAGVTPSGYTPGPGDPHYGQAQYGYSGGANNYPRFLESWSNDTCTYHGSMVELFQSKVFTGKWDTGNIYVPPTRRWNFDTNFTNNPPPGSLEAVAITRGSWVKF